MKKINLMGNMFQNANCRVSYIEDNEVSFYTQDTDIQFGDLENQQKNYYRILKIQAHIRGYLVRKVQTSKDLELH